MRIKFLFLLALGSAGTLSSQDKKPASRATWLMVKTAYLCGQMDVLSDLVGVARNPEKTRRQIRDLPMQAACEAAKELIAAGDALYGK